MWQTGLEVLKIHPNSYFDTSLMTPAAPQSGPKRCDTVRVNLDGIEGGQHQQDNLGTKRNDYTDQLWSPCAPCPPQTCP